MFKEWRSRYEAWAYQVCESVDAIPARWSGERCPATPVVPTPELTSIVAMGPAEARVRRAPESGRDPESRRDPESGDPRA